MARCSTYTRMQYFKEMSKLSNLIHNMSFKMAKTTGIPQIVFKDVCVSNIQIHLKSFSLISQCLIYEPHESVRPFGKTLVNRYRKITTLTKFKVITTKFNYQKHRKFISNKYKLMLESIKDKHRINFSEFIQVNSKHKSNGIISKIFRKFRNKLVENTIGYIKFDYYK